MRIISRNEIRILAIHDDMVFMFDTDALKCERIGWKLMGMYLDKEFNLQRVLVDSKYHKMFLKARTVVEIDPIRLAKLVATENQIAQLKNAGVDFEGHGVTI